MSSSWFDVFVDIWSPYGVFDLLCSSVPIEWSEVRVERLVDRGRIVVHVLSGTASEAAMPLGELRWRNATQAAARSSFVVVPAPCRDHDPRLVQRLEPLLVQAFVAQFAVEAFDQIVLHRLAWIDQQMPRAVGCAKPSTPNW